MDLVVTSTRTGKHTHLGWTGVRETACGSRVSAIRVGSEVTVEQASQMPKLTCDKCQGRLDWIIERQAAKAGSVR